MPDESTDDHPASGTLDGPTLTELRRRGALTSQEDRVWLRLHLDRIPESSRRVLDILRRILHTHEDLDDRRPSTVGS